MLGIHSKENFIIKSLKILVFFTILLAPLFFSTKHLYFFTTPKYVLIAGAGSICFGLILLQLINTKFSLPPKLLIAFGLPTLFILWLLITSYTGIDFSTSIWSNFGRHTGFLTYFFGLVFFWTSLIIYHRENFTVPLKAMALGGAIASISIYLGPALLGLELFILKVSAGGGTFGNSTYAAIYLAFSIFSAAILFFRENIKKYKIMWGICFFLILFSPVFINFNNNFVGEARAGLVSLIAGLLVSVLIYFSFHTKKIVSRVSKTALVLFVLILVYVSISLVRPEGRLNNYFSNTKEGVRFFYWDMAAKGISERPLTGFGLENFPYIHNKDFDPVLLSPNYPSESWADKPHNMFLELAFSSGLPGLLLYLSLIGYALVSLVKKASISTSQDRLTATLLAGMLAAYNLQLFFAFDTVYSILALFVTLGSIFVFCYKETKESEKIKFSNKLIVSFVLLIIGLLMIYFLSFKVGQESKKIKELNSLSIPNRITKFKETMDIAPTGTLVTEAQYIDIAITRYKNAWSTLDSKVKEGGKTELEFLLDYSKKRSDQYPHDLRFALVAAKLANMLYEISSTKEVKLLETAKKYGARAVFNSPGGEKGYQTLIQTYLLEGKINRALNFGEILLSSNPHVPEFHNLVIYLAKLKNDPRLVDEKIKNAKKFIPNYKYGMERQKFNENNN